MSFDARRWRFTGSMIEDAPDWKGVYVLWSGATPLVIGRATGGGNTIRSQLIEHYERGAPQVTHYSWEICPDPARREAQLADELARCTERASS